MTIERSPEEERWAKQLEGDVAFYVKAFNEGVSRVERELLTQLYEYYDQQVEMEDVHDVSSDADYLQGLLDATQAMLTKIDCKYPTYEEYVDKKEETR